MAKSVVWGVIVAGAIAGIVGVSEPASLPSETEPLQFVPADGGQPYQVFERPQLLAVVPDDQGDFELVNDRVLVPVSGHTGVDLVTGRLVWVDPWRVDYANPRVKLTLAENAEQAEIQVIETKRLVDWDNVQAKWART
jgi:hypothetical protein